MTFPNSFMTLSMNLNYKRILNRQQQEEEEEENTGDEFIVEPHLNLILRSEVEVEGDVIVNQIESRHKFNECSSSFLKSFIEENEPLPMGFLMNSQAADSMRVTISNVIFHLVSCCVGFEALKRLQVEVIYRVYEKQEEVDVVRERRMALMQKSECSSIGEKEVCAVCLEVMEGGGKEVVCTPCSHRFHGQCVGRWFEKSGLCPLCRFQVGP